MVKEFKADPMDLLARYKPRKTINNDDCAIVVVLTNVKGPKFNANMGIEGSVEYRDGE